MPEAIVAFLDATSYEDPVRNAVSPGGDSDTLACITGGIAEAFYGPLPDFIAARAKATLTAALLEATERFCRRYGVSP